jgi:very-short-patch-repair endonuclease
MDGVSESLEVPPRHGEGDHPKGGGGGSRFTRRPQTYIARKLRKAMTLPEGMFWQRLRGKQTGVKFRTQHRIGNYVVDFYCSSARLVV